mmetsp:Transcript_24075/g.54019  ORF Transcript_24075/g.54019 Transcript_24075/m.54019 type:complete len:271 (+) Transcript_24075:553-1365(+)
MRLHPVVDWLEEFVFLPLVVLLAQVDQEKSRLGSQKHPIIEKLNILGGPVVCFSDSHSKTDFLPLLQPLQHLVRRVDFCLPLLLGCCVGIRLGLVLHQICELSVHKLLVFLSELSCDDLNVSDRIDFVLYVHNVRVLEGTQHVHDAIDSSDVGEERVAKTSALGRSLDKPGNVADLEPGVNDALGVVGLKQPVEPLVRHIHTSLVGVDGTEGEVLSGDGAFRERVVQRRLAHVGQPDDSNLEPVGEATESPGSQPFCRLFLLGRHFGVSP